MSGQRVHWGGAGWWDQRGSIEHGVDEVAFNSNILGGITVMSSHKLESVFAIVGGLSVPFVEFSKNIGK